MAPISDGPEITWTRDLDDYVTFAELSPDGAAVLAGSLSGRVVILDSADGSVVAELAPHPLGALSGGWSSDGSRAATSGQDDRLRVHGGASVAEVAVDGWGVAVAWSPVDPIVAVAAGRTLVVVDGDGAVVARWDGLPSTVTATAWSPDGTSVGAACYGGLHWFRPSDPGRRPRHMSWKGSLLSVAVAPDGRWAAAGCQDATAHVWRLWSGDDLQMSGYGAKIEHLAWDPTSRYLAIASIGEISLWDFAGRGPQGTRPRTFEGHPRHVTALAYSRDGSRLASGDGAGTLLIWEPPSRTRPVRSATLEGAVSCLSWSPDGATIAVGTGRGAVAAVAMAG